LYLALLKLTYLWCLFKASKIGRRPMVCILMPLLVIYLIGNFTGVFHQLTGTFRVVTGKCSKQQNVYPFLYIANLQQLVI